MKHRRDLTPGEVRAKAQANAQYFEWCRDNDKASNLPETREEYAKWFAARFGSDAEPYPY